MNCTMKIFFSLLLLIPSVLFSQGTIQNLDSSNKASFFENGLSWGQILQQAKAEGKYVFVYCFDSRNSSYASMDQVVFSSDSVCNYMWRHFISVRVQIDSTDADKDWTKSWYDNAHLF